MIRNLINSELVSLAHIMKLEPIPGTYALILKSDLTTCVKIGSWRDIQLRPC
jgi:hypothetical protein